MLLTRRSLWPAIAVAIVLAEGFVDLLHGMTPQLTAAYTAANVVEPMIGASLVLACCGGPPDLRRTRDLVVFVIGACVSGPMIGGLFTGLVGYW